MPCRIVSHLARLTKLWALTTLVLMGNLDILKSLHSKQINRVQKFSRRKRMTMIIRNHLSLSLNNRDVFVVVAPWVINSGQDAVCDGEALCTIVLWIICTDGYVAASHEWSVVIWKVVVESDSKYDNSDEGRESWSMLLFFPTLIAFMITTFQHSTVIEEINANQFETWAEKRKEIIDRSWINVNGSMHCGPLMRGESKVIDKGTRFGFVGRV